MPFAMDCDRTLHSKAFHASVPEVGIAGGGVGVEVADGCSGTSVAVSVGVTLGAAVGRGVSVAVDVGETADNVTRYN